MIAVQFFVEGISDRKFLKDLVKRWYLVDLRDDDINVLEGKDAFKSYKAIEKLRLLHINFEQNRNDGIRSIVILDADHDFEKRKFETSLFALEFNFDYYLWPNHELSGDLESLLEQIYNPANQDFFECWQGYENCLNASENILHQIEKPRFLLISNRCLAHQRVKKIC